MAKYICSSIALLLILSTIGAPSADAQMLKRLKERAKERVEENIGRKQDKAIDEAMEGDAAASESASAAESTPESAAAVQSLKPGEGAWANYDFIPGERPIYVDDFTGDNVGDFPRRMEFKSGSMEIIEWQGKRWLRGEGGEFFINLAEPLPDRFTIEFELAGAGNDMEVTFVDDPDHRRRLNINAFQARIRSGDVDGEGSLGVDTREQPVKIRIAGDGQYVKLYANEKRVLNVPNANLGRSNRIYVNLNGWSAEDPRMIADIRIMAGGRKLYDALSAEGRVVTQGIYFDTGSDQLRPESSPTLKEIGQMLNEHPDLRLRIEGHTDNTGSADGNRSLSLRRADSVRAFLLATYGIDALRIETAGLGPDSPVGDNATLEGRQMNRRVELVKL